MSDAEREAQIRQMEKENPTCFMGLLLRLLDEARAEIEAVVPEEPTLAMLERAVRVAAATGADITETQAHDIWQAMMDEWLGRDDR